MIVNGGQPFFSSYDYYIQLGIYGSDPTKKKTFSGKVASQVKNLVRDLGEFGLIKPRPWPNPIPVEDGGFKLGSRNYQARKKMMKEGETLFIGVGVCRPHELGIG